jgi:hypothetical protein
VGSAMKKKERIKDWISERDHDRLKSLLKNDFNTQLEPLKSLKTATKKRRELKGNPESSLNVGRHFTMSQMSQMSHRPMSCPRL